MGSQLGRIGTPLRGVGFGALLSASCLLVGGCADGPQEQNRRVGGNAPVLDGGPDVRTPPPMDGAPDDRREPTADSGLVDQGLADGPSAPPSTDADVQSKPDFAVLAPDTSAGDAGTVADDGLAAIPDARAEQPDADCESTPSGCENPPDPCDNGACAGLPGAPCETAEDCAGEEPYCVPAADDLGPTGFVDGYCLQLHCGEATPCPGGAVCIQLDGEGQTGCVQACDRDADCRPEYQCDPSGICLPEPVCEPIEEVCNNFDDDCDGRVDDGNDLCPPGAVCTQGRCDECGGVDSAGECAGGVAEWCNDGSLNWSDCTVSGLDCRVVRGVGATCVGSIGAACVDSDQCGDDVDCVPEDGPEGPSGLPGGMCILFNCADDSDCDGGSACFQIDEAGNTACLATCVNDDDCRPGYVCYDPGVCLAPEAPVECTAERCNGNDDDCDGTIDNGACGVLGCAAENPCENGRCVADLPQGWCFVECGGDEDCPGSSVCIAFDSGLSACVEACDAANRCPLGWTCLDQGLCWLDCNFTGCANGAVCGADGQCQQAPDDVRIDITVVGVEIFPVDRLSGDEPWDGPGGAILELVLDLAQDFARAYLDAKFCKTAEGAVPIGGQVVGDVCRELLDNLLDLLRELIDAALGGLFGGIEPPDARGTAALTAASLRLDENRVLGEVGDSYSPNWQNITFSSIAPTEDLVLTIDLIDVDLAFDDPIGSVTLNYDDIVTAFGDGRPIPIDTSGQGAGNIMAVRLRVGLSQ